jgi:hypothetical protein
MKKMRLDPDTLSVETFDASPREGGARGTVRAQSASTEGESCDICPVTHPCTPEAGSCGSSCDFNAPCGCGWLTADPTCFAYRC